ncbi:hypothetical protein BC827DRAFT_1208889 [Russula dissimulans]|nr:hypothetical protein BC827DRAFT_1208889 [Russula dissimulans]
MCVARSAPLPAPFTPLNGHPPTCPSPTFTPLSSRILPKKPKLDRRSPYTIVNPLRPPRSTSYSVRALYELIVDGLINLYPDYQREVVWSEQKQIGGSQGLMELERCVQTSDQGLW